jgi:CRISPR-associated protein (TIGR02710 family)
MSVAAVLATINESSQYYYVGSVDKTGRTSDGIGVVLNGHEMSFFEANPWIVLAVTARREIALLFNHGRYGPAMEHTRKLADLSPTEMERVYNALADLIEGYVLWDRFKRDQAKIKLNKALGILEAYIADRDDPLRFTITTVRKNVEFLNRLMDNKDPDWERLDTLDLLANAHRRASLAQRYDDAVARLYALLESLARNRLLSQYKIKNNAVQPDQIPEKLRAEFVRRLTDPTAPQKGLRLGLQDSFYLLDEKGDDLGRRYKENEIKINKLLNARNQSRLAHGTQPIDPDVYSQLSTFIMEFIDATPAELPEFPEMRL